MASAKIGVMQKYIVEGEFVRVICATLDERN